MRAAARPGAWELVALLAAFAWLVPATVRAWQTAGPRWDWAAAVWVPALVLVAMATLSPPLRRSWTALVLFGLYLAWYGWITARALPGVQVMGARPAIVLGLLAAGIGGVLAVAFRMRSRASGAQ